MNGVFAKGEAVVYPMHGAGIIEDLEEKNFDGINKNYFVLRLPLGNLTILLCQDTIQSSNLRHILPQDDIARIMKETAFLPVPTKPDNWNQRYKENMEKIKSGELGQTAAVFHELYHRETQKGLSGAEKKTLTTARKIVVSEIMLSFNLEKEAAEVMLENYMRKKSK
ncbi:MAG: CarD family transcriptional regulator [Defluviitaleaceae bacterium]|nr:CarD family transcriptional regulator [Defluviitaleaceae bacterium]